MELNFNTYPIWYTESQKQAFDQIRSIAKQIEFSKSLIVEEQNSNHIFIELVTNQVTNEMWDMIEDFNTGIFPLTVSFAFTNENVEGERYAINV